MSLRKFDVFPKLVNEYRVGTVWGGILSLLSLFFAIGLAWVEIHSYLHPQIRQKLIVDSTRPTGEDGVTISMDNLPRLKSFINITFPRAPCYLLHIDVIDSITQMSIPLDKVKTSFTRLSPSGQQIGVLPLDFMNITSNPPPAQCPSCLIDQQKCCRTCLDVYNAFKEKGVQVPKLADIPQCSEVKKQISQMDNEGCRVESSFRAVRVGGEFHIAPGMSWFSEGWHVHDCITFGKLFKDINLTHTITRLQFAKTKDPLPLDNFTFIHPQSIPSLRVVYTADILEDNFSASRFSMDSSKNRMIPGIFFKYDVSPITATTYLDKEPKLHLVTRLLTVFGAVLGIFRFVDHVIYSASKSTKHEEIEQ